MVNIGVVHGGGVVVPVGKWATARNTGVPLTDTTAGANLPAYQSTTI